MNTGISKFLNWIIVLLGIIEIVSPVFLGITTLPALANGLIVGVALIILGVSAAMVRSASAARTLDIIMALLGAWLIILPVALGYDNLSGGLLKSPVLIGVVVLVLAVLAVLRNNAAIVHAEQSAAVYGSGGGAGRDVSPEVTAVKEERDNPSASQQESGAPAAAATAVAEGPSRAGEKKDPDTASQEDKTGQPAEVSQPEDQPSDEGILDDIVSRLREDKFMEASNIHVRVKDGDVVLTGYVPTAEEYRLAEDTARKVDGVQKVHNDLHVGKDVASQAS